MIGVDGRSDVVFARRDRQEIRAGHVVSLVNSGDMPRVERISLQTARLRPRIIKVRKSRKKRGRKGVIAAPHYLKRAVVFKRHTSRVNAAQAKMIDSLGNSAEVIATQCGCTQVKVGDFAFGECCLERNVAKLREKYVLKGYLIFKRQCLPCADIDREQNLLS